MPAPTNTDATTAIDLGAFPATYTQDVNFGGTTYTVWTQFTATEDGVVSLWGRGVIGGGGTDYLAICHVYLGPASAPVQYPDTVSMTGTNVPLQFPVTDGVTYYQKWQSSHGNVAAATLTVDAEYFVNASAPRGTLLVPDDSPPFPLAMLSSTTGEVLQFQLGFPPGEQGVSEPSIGAILVDDNTSTVRKFKLYTSTIGYTGISLAHTNAHGTPGNPDVGISFGRTNHSFYAGWISSGTTMQLRRLSPMDLTVQATWTLAGVTNIRAIAPNAAETFLYLSGKAGTTGSAISKYDLGGSAFVADFAATIANYIATEILVLTNDTVVVLYQKNSATRDLLVKTYDNTGAVLHSKSYGSAITDVSVSRLTYALDDPTSFWLWRHNDDGTDTIKNVKVSDLSDLASFTTTEYEEGVYQPAQSSDPVRFGNSQSCPFFVLRSVSTVTETFPIRRQRRFLLPSSDDNKNMQIPIIKILMRTGIGLKPDSWTPDVTTPLGANPQVRIRLSKDGGETWGPERILSAGLRGRFKDRVLMLQATGNYRNAVLEVTVDAPVDWQFLAALGDPVEGSS